MPLPKGLTRRKNSGVYWIRIRVPAAVQAAVGRRELVESLGTKDKPTAEALFDQRMAEIRSGWHRLAASNGVEPSHKQLAAFAGEFYRSIVAKNENEPGDPDKWRLDRITETRPVAPRRVMGPVGSSVGAEMNAFLEARGYSIGGRYREVVGRFYEAKLHAYRTLGRMARGDYSEGPAELSYPALTHAPPSPERRRPLTVEGDWQAYAEATDLSPGTRKRWRPMLVRLTEYLGRCDLSGVTADEAVDWKGHVAKPRSDGSTLSSATINDGYLAAARAFFAWAKDERRVPANPFAGVAVAADKVTHNAPPGAKSLSREEAELILSESLRPPDARVSETFAAARRWVPWLCAYTGARVNEMTQLRSQDVFPVGSQADAVWVLRITPEAGTVKTRKARDVPLHPHLVEQGFPAFAAGRKGPLFYKDGTGTAENPAYRKVGDKLAAWVRAIGVDRRVAPNHGWRHGFNTLARSARMPEETRDHLTGHAPRTEGEAYGEFKLAMLAEDVAKIPRYEVSPPEGARPRTAASRRASAQRTKTRLRSVARGRQAGDRGAEA